MAPSTGHTWPAAGASRALRAHFAIVASLALCVALASSSVAFGAVLDADATWSDEVLVEESTTVASGATLRIEAGATVRLGANVDLRIEGRLLAEGTEESPITLTRIAGGDSWGHLVFAAADDSVLRHVTIEYAGDEGDHKDYYDDTDEDCQPVDGPRPPRDYHEAVVVLASHVDIEHASFRNLPDGNAGEGDAIAVISDDPEVPGASTANIRDSEFIAIGQGIHTRYSYVLVERCYFTGHRGDNDDIDLYGESDPVPLILDNVMVDPDHDDMINPTRCSPVIAGNVIAGSDDHGIVLRDRGFPVLYNNVIYDCSSAAIAVQNTCDALIVNNTIADCGRGVRFFDHDGRWDRPYCLVPGSGSATIVNTVIWDCGTTLDIEDSPSEADSRVVIEHCDIQDGEGRIDVESEAELIYGPGNVSVVPGFVDADEGDFRLTPDSELIDVGRSEGAPEYDFDGASRPCGGGVDIGAFEFTDHGCGPAPVLFQRADANADGSLDVSDPVSVLRHLFLGGEALPCEKSADADDSGTLDLSDAVATLRFLFQGGDPLPEPLGHCGEDPTPDDLDCSESGC